MKTKYTAEQIRSAGEQVSIDVENLIKILEEKNNEEQLANELTDEQICFWEVVIFVFILGILSII